MRTFLHRVSIAVLFMAAAVAPAWASCGSANCPVDTTSGERREQGWVSAGYQFEYIEQDKHRIGTRRAAFGEVQGDHDEEFTLNRIHRFLASVGLTDRLSLDVSLPFISRSHAHIDHDGGDLLEAWDINGLGDFSTQIRYAFFKPISPQLPTLSAILGGEFPTGAHREKNDEGDEAEAGIQPGSGSYDLIAGLSSLQTFSAPMLDGRYGTLPLFSSVIGQFNGAGNENYRLGDTLNVNLGTAYPVLPKLGLLAQLNFTLRDRDGIGDTREEVQKTGGEFLYFSPGLEFRPTENWRAYALIQIPVYQRVNSIQVVSDYNVLFGMTYRFKAFGRGRKST